MAPVVLGILAGGWGLVMAVSPVLQIRRMMRLGSSRDVSVGYYGVLLPGFGLWIAYGAVRSDWALIVPNMVATLVASTTIAVALVLRRRASAEAMDAPLARGPYAVDDA
jgi:MtN3 and saliva related transmembrane protein